jgi:hypothetical protein
MTQVAEVTQQANGFPKLTDSIADKCHVQGRLSTAAIYKEAF